MDGNGILGHLNKAFGGDFAADITEDRLRVYVNHRLKDDPKPARATINRELAMLRRGFRLSRKTVAMIPDFSEFIVKEDNARKGFFEVEEFDRILKELPAYLRPVIQTAYITGWRIGELRKLRVEHLDLKNGILRLDPGMTKNKQPRVFYLTDDLRTILDDQVRRNHEFQMASGKWFAWLFHYHGHQIGKETYKNGWKSACKRAGLEGKLVHDFRRTAVRNLEFAGVERSTSMKITGHLTESVFRRYAIVNEEQFTNASEKLQRLHDRQNAAAKKVAS
jgi:integrase